MSFGKICSVNIKMKKSLSLITKSFTVLFLVLAFCGTIAVACSNPPSKPEKPEKPEKPAKPEKIITKPCKPLKPIRTGKGGKVASYSLSDPCYTLYNLNQIIGEEGLEREEGLAEVLPELLSSEITGNFSQEEFAQAIAEATETFGEVVSFNFPNKFTVQGDWAEAELEITTTTGQQLKYLVIFHQEENSWKIFATEEI